MCLCVRQLIELFLGELNSSWDGYVQGQPLLLRQYLHNHCFCDVELTEMLVFNSYEDIRTALPPKTRNLYAVISEMFCTRKYTECNI